VCPAAAGGGGGGPPRVWGGGGVGWEVVEAGRWGFGGSGGAVFFFAFALRPAMTLNGRRADSERPPPRSSS
jgi:hypothetical protein